jgi:hypothetical protein
MKRELLMIKRVLDVGLIDSVLFSNIIATTEWNEKVTVNCKLMVC